MTEDEAEHQAALEKAIQASLSHASPDHDAEDEDLKLAIQMSKHEPPQFDEDSELKLALQNSKEDSTRAKTEEEVGLDYVKKQSLLEEEHRKAVEGKQADTPAAQEVDKEPMSKADEEALRKAIEESMKSVEDAQASGLGH
jgi:hypothetical protein